MIKNIIKHINGEKKGSITVEAAFVMPVVLFTVFALIYLTFYLHDYNRIQGIVNLVIHRACIAAGNDDDIESGQIFYEDINYGDNLYGNLGPEERKITGLLEQELTGGLFISHISKMEVETGKLEIKINVIAETDIDLPLFKTAINKLHNIKVEGRYPVHNPAETIRICELILDTGSKIKGSDKLKSILEKLPKGR